MTEPPDIKELLQAAGRLEDPASALAAITSLRDHLERLQAVHVENALRSGWTWNQVAETLGVSRQAAHRRYAGEVRGKLEEARDARAAEGAFLVTGPARLAVHFGRQQAQAMRRDGVGTEHVLLGLLRLETGIVPGTLVAAGATLDAARGAVDALQAEVDGSAPTGRVARGPKDPAPARLQPTPQCRTALERSLHEAIELGDDRLRPEHVLLALLRDPDAGAVRTLERLEVDVGALVARLARPRPGAGAGAGA